MGLTSISFQAAWYIPSSMETATASMFTRISWNHLNKRRHTHRRHPEVLAVSGEPRRMGLRRCVRLILRGAQERAPQDDGGASGKTSQSQIRLPYIRIGADLRRAALHRHAAGLQDV